MDEKWLVYTNSDSTARRIVRILSKSNFVVFKEIFNDKKEVVAWTVKYWSGDFERTLASWNTNVPADISTVDIDELHSYALEASINIRAIITN